MSDSIFETQRAKVDGGHAAHPHCYVSFSFANIEEEH